MYIYIYISKDKVECFSDSIWVYIWREGGGGGKGWGGGWGRISRRSGGTMHPRSRTGIEMYSWVSSLARFSWPCQGTPGFGCHVTRQTGLCAVARPRTNEEKRTEVHVSFFNFCKARNLARQIQRKRHTCVHAFVSRLGLNCMPCMQCVMNNCSRNDTDSEEN